MNNENGHTLPEGWKVAELKKILPEDAINALAHALSNVRGKSSEQNYRVFLAIFEPHRAHMVARGVLPEYLARVFESKVAHSA